jgi:hypothetical protein
MKLRSPVGRSSLLSRRPGWSSHVPWAARVEPTLSALLRWSRGFEREGDADPPVLSHLYFQRTGWDGAAVALGAILAPLAVDLGRSSLFPWAARVEPTLATFCEGRVGSNGRVMPAHLSSHTCWYS